MIPDWLKSRHAAFTVPRTVIDGIRPRKLGSHRTLRWREMDSNHRYRIKNNPFWLPRSVPQFAFRNKNWLFRVGDRWFESISLQRRVRSELSQSGSGPMSAVWGLRIVTVSTLAPPRASGNFGIGEPKLPRSLPYPLGKDLNANILFAPGGRRPRARLV
jgi:hypothetical protein